MNLDQYHTKGATTSAPPSRGSRRGDNRNAVAAVLGQANSSSSSSGNNSNLDNSNSNSSSSRQGSSSSSSSSGKIHHTIFLSSHDSIVPVGPVSALLISTPL